MSGAPSALFVDSDDALGSPRGDVDDAFAIAAILTSGNPVAGCASVFGNTTEPRAHANIAELAAVCGATVPVLRGATAPGRGATEASRFLEAPPRRLRVVALGPLTNLAAAIRGSGGSPPWEEIIVVGGNRSTRGRWPPWWPFEFNLTRDRPAAKVVFESPVPLTVVPLDVARRLRVDRARLDHLGGRAGGFLREGSARWLRRARLLKGARSFPVWDLAAALSVTDPDAFDRTGQTVRLHPSGRVEFGRRGREAVVVNGFDPAGAWELFLERIGRAGCRPAPQTPE